MGNVCVLNIVVVLVFGYVLVMDFDRLWVVVDQSSNICILLVCYGLVVYVQVQQIVGCNVVYFVELWLLCCLFYMYDFFGEYWLLFIQEEMVQMIGVWCNSVFFVVNILQQVNFIYYSCGYIQIVNLEGLCQIMCECYFIVKMQYDCLFVVC